MTHGEPATRSVAKDGGADAQGAHRAARRFLRFAGIDWSGEAVARPTGIAFAIAEAGDAPPLLVTCQGGWSREGVLNWILAAARANADVLIGIDFSAALPFADRGGYFPGWAQSPADARGLWALIDRLCADEPHLSASRFADLAEPSRHYRRPGLGQGDLFEATMGRLRVVERACRAARLGNAVSCFNLVGASQVGKSSLTGMRLLHRLGGRVPIWPFDPVPETGPLIVEIYTSIAARRAGLTGSRTKVRDPATLDAALEALGSGPHLPLARYDDHATDAILAAAWLRVAADDATLWSPPRLDASLAATEGWTFGVP